MASSSPTSPRPAVDLERELTCSICTDLLYQPLTLLDCLHTFCGACLKDWFGWQATAAEHAPVPPPDPDAVYTCPSCRAAVRDTRHNATVATLLDMFLQANPDKARPAAERDEMDRKYGRGEKVLRRLSVLERTEEERRLDEEERRLIEEVRALSLREAVEGEPSAGAERRRSRVRSRDVSVEGGGSARDRARRRVAEEETRRRSEQADGGGGRGGGLRPEAEGGRSRSSTSRSRQRAAESDGRAGRHVEHQSSLRSLISTGDNRNMTQSEVDREIEDFARQIQEEGLLEGLDLDNLDLSSNDELSRKITEAYRRRQRQRSRHEAARRSNASAASHHSDPPTPDATTRSSHLAVTSSRGTSRQGSRSRSVSQSGRAEDRSGRPTSSSGATHLSVEQPRRPRRRTASGGDGGRRSATVPVGISQPEPRAAAARSQTDLSLRTTNTEAGRPALASEGRSTSTPATTTSAPTSSPNTLPFSARAAATGLGILQPPPQQQQQQQQPAPPSPQPTAAADHAAAAPAFFATADPLSLSPSLSSPTTPNPPRKTGGPAAGPPARSPLYPEPSITCKRCQRPHIEYTVHYNCGVCHGGGYNLCQDCYRRGRGCLHWFGFGRAAARQRWSALLASAQPPERKEPPPHMLTANRYRPPRRPPGGAEGRVTLTNQDPAARLESGTFCVRCARWTTHEVYWRCEACNEGEWGFCSGCVASGACCAHALVPLRYEKEEAEAAGETGPFRPVVVLSRCDICRTDLAPAQRRLHCYACPSAARPAPDERWEACEACYARLEAEGRVSAPNGARGWRRCPAGHRTAVVAFVDAPRDGVLRRAVLRDLVGGRTLGFADEPTADPGTQVAYWVVGGRRFERLVTRDVAAVPDEGDVGVVGRRWADGFPPDGGAGGRAVARWAWYPAEGAEDELLFPKGAEVREIEDVNGEWFHGVYMGAKGLFPAPYVVPLADGAE